MRKLLGSTLALAMMFSSAPAFSAELFKNVTASGQIDLQATSGRNIVDFVTRGNDSATNNDRIGDAQTRLMASIGMDLLDDVHGMVTVTKNDRSYGTAGGQTFGHANSQRLSGMAADGVTGNIFVDQAFFKIDKIGGSVDATFGRQFFGNSGDMVIYFGPSDAAWHGLPVSSLDGARFDWSNDQHSVTGLVAKVDGSNVGTLGSDDTDLRGLTAMCKGENHNVGAYLWNVVKHGPGALGTSPAPGTQGGKNSNLYIIGAKGKITLGNAWVKGEIAKNFGTDRRAEAASFDPAEPPGSRRFTGFAAMVNGGAKLEVGGVGAVTPWGEAAYGTGDRDARDNQNGDFQTVNGDYRPGLIYGRFASGNDLSGASGIGNGVFGVPVAEQSLSNRVIVGAGVKVTPESVNKLTVGAQVYQFRTQTFAQATPEGAAAVFGGNKNIGTEAGLTATWAHSDNVTLTASVADFQPGGLIRAGRNATDDHRVNAATMAAFDVRVKFGSGGKGS